MFKPEEVLEGARSIRPYLTQLLGLDAEKVDKELAALLAQAKSGQKVDDRILELLKSYKATRDWMAEFLSPQQISKGYQRLAGSSQATPMPKYVCPEGDDYDWYLHAVGDAIPTCPTHGVQLVPAQT